MNYYGKLTGFERIGNCVKAAFEGGTLEITVLTEKIVRIFSAFTEEKIVSKAIETEKSIEVEFTAEGCDDGVKIQTPELTVIVKDEACVDIFDKNGKALCTDYKGERKAAKELDEQTKAFIGQEGHNVEDALGHKIQVLKKMDGDEAFYGMGDKTGFLNKRGYEFQCWNTDNPDAQLEHFKALYKSIPFFITLKKDAVFGLFFDNTFHSWFDFAKESDKYFWFGADEGNLDYYFIGGETMQEVVQGYTYLTGTAPLPQLWTLGYHQSRWGYKCEADIRGIAENMKRYEIPCDVIHMDIDYMDGYRVFTVDSERFPDMKALTEDLKEDGIRLVTIIDPGVKLDEAYSVYADGLKKGYYALDKEGEVYVNAVWPGDSVYPDFGRSEVREWWGENHKALTEAGVSGIWNDMNEPASFRGELPADVVFYDEDRKTCHAEMHNVYGHNMSKGTYEGLKKLTGKRPFVITRACYSGTQKYAIGWTGDNHSLWAHLQMAIPQLCNLGLSGMPLVGTDIGGFGSDCTKELMCRWIEAGSFSPLCRNHASAGTREQEPWQFDEETIEIYKKYLNLRYELLPYYYDLCKQEEETGLPIMRPLILHYEKDENVKNLNGQFMMGESMIVAPVVEQGATRKMVYLPEGEWYDYWTKEKVNGGGYLIREAALDVCPIYVKAGTILPKYPARRCVSEKKDETLILECYGTAAAYTHYQDNGEDFKYRDGEYNLYQFKVTENGLSQEMLHEGYEKTYKEIKLVVFE